MSDEVSPADRRAFIAERRRASVHRFDTLHSPHYDENWGAISPSHAAFVGSLARLIRPGGHVLDAACGVVGLAGVLKPQAPAYVTVEVHDGPLTAPVDPRQVPDEHFEGGNGGYHYYQGGPEGRSRRRLGGLAVAPAPAGQTRRSAGAQTSTGPRLNRGKVSGPRRFDTGTPAAAPIGLMRSAWKSARSRTSVRAAAPV